MVREERDERDHGEERERPRRARRPAADDRRPASDDRRDPRPASDTRRSATTARSAARSAARELRDLTGHDPESITSVERHGDGWLVGVEVLETHRIPDSTDILAEYRVEVDGEGGLVSYRRARRYYRGRSEEGT
ncbi:gas vesicle protein GvpO [Streptomyces sp. Rer75]|uniref:gas vesicle protein GvpO n=1 Tax=unclassified Streptomyces TaxID=2593676 RepID=UPI0015D003A3|nr:gas vesicle protein GvpO [Streptomyces sp. Rer75]QLH19918.1 gas vesicle protein [Streptomyces sp. Rer75]